MRWSTNERALAAAASVAGSAQPRVAMTGVSSAPFHALASSLKQGAFPAHARRLEDVLNGTWTTSSEMISELGSVVLAIRKECTPLTLEQKQLVQDCLRQVRRAWPGFGVLQGIWPPWRT